MIVHIVDVSSPSREKQESAVTGVLDEMKVSDKPRLTLWNKLDLLPEEEQRQVRVDAEERGELTVAASAKTSQGLDDFVTCLEVNKNTLRLLSRARSILAKFRIKPPANIAHNEQATKDERRDKEKIVH